MPSRKEDMTEIVRGMDPSWYESMLMKMAAKYPEEFYSCFSDVISENAARNLANGNFGNPRQ
jgi:hypothetical protein